MTLSLRQLVAGEGQAYRTLRLTALATEPRAFGSDYEREAAWPLTRHEQTLADCTVFAAFDAGTMVAMAGFSPVENQKSRHLGHVFGVYVDPAHRGKRIGERLLAALIAHAQGRVRQLHLGVGSYNGPAIALYQRMGFETYGTEPRSLYVDGHYIDEHLMVRFLDKEDRA